MDKSELRYLVGTGGSKIPIDYTERYGRRILALERKVRNLEKTINERSDISDPDFILKGKPMNVSDKVGGIVVPENLCVKENQNVDIDNLIEVLSTLTREELTSVYIKVLFTDCDKDSIKHIDTFKANSILHDYFIKGDDLKDLNNYYDVIFPCIPDSVLEKSEVHSEESTDSIIVKDSTVQLSIKDPQMNETLRHMASGAESRSFSMVGSEVSDTLSEEPKSSDSNEVDLLQITPMGQVVSNTLMYILGQLNKVKKNAEKRKWQICRVAEVELNNIKQVHKYLKGSKNSINMDKLGYQLFKCMNATLLHPNKAGIMYVLRNNWGFNDYVCCVIFHGNKERENNVCSIYTIDMYNHENRPTKHKTTEVLKNSLGSDDHLEVLKEVTMWFIN